MKQRNPWNHRAGQVAPVKAPVAPVKAKKAKKKAVPKITDYEQPDYSGDSEGE